MRNFNPKIKSPAKKQGTKKQKTGFSTVFVYFRRKYSRSTKNHQSRIFPGLGSSISSGLWGGLQWFPFSYSTSNVFTVVYCGFSSFRILPLGIIASTGGEALLEVGLSWGGIFSCKMFTGLLDVLGFFYIVGL